MKHEIRQDILAIKYKFVVVFKLNAEIEQWLNI